MIKIYLEKQFRENNHTPPLPTGENSRSEHNQHAKNQVARGVEQNGREEGDRERGELSRQEDNVDLVCEGKKQASQGIFFYAATPASASNPLLTGCAGRTNNDEIDCGAEEGGQNQEHDGGEIFSRKIGNRAE